MAKNPPANAGDTSLNPGPGKILHDSGQLSPYTATIELVVL